MQWIWIIEVIITNLRPLLILPIFQFLAFNARIIIDLSIKLVSKKQHNKESLCNENNDQLLFLSFLKKKKKNSTLL